MPAEVVEKALSIAVHLCNEKLGDISQSDDSTFRGKIHDMGQQLVQVARNSLLDVDALR